MFNANKKSITVNLKDPRGLALVKDLLAKDEDVVGKIDPARLDGLFDPSHHLRHLDEVFERVEAL